MLLCIVYYINMTKVFSIILLIVLGFSIWQAVQINSLKKLNASQQIAISDLNLKLKEADKKIADLNKKQDIHPIEQKVQDCMKQHNFTTAGMSQCVNESIADWSGEIDKYISLFRTKLSKEQFASLQNSQARWEKYKTAEWNSLNSIFGAKSGTIYINILSGTKADIVEARAKYLAALYNILFSDF